MADETNGWRGQITEAVSTIKKEVEELFRRVAASEQMVHCRDWRLDVEGRLRILEGFRWKAIGIVGLIQLIGVGLVILAVKAIISSAGAGQ